MLGEGTKKGRRWPSGRPAGDRSATDQVTIITPRLAISNRATCTPTATPASDVTQDCAALHTQL